MTKWLVRCQTYEFVYDSREGKPDTRWEDLRNAIALEGQDGWEPFTIDMKSNFDTNFDRLFTIGHVWYKRPE